MKREYSYVSIIIVAIIFAIISGLVAYLLTSLFKLEETSTLLTLITSIINFISSFIITSGLINNRTGGVGDYLNQIKRLDSKAVVVNLIMIAVTTILSVFLGASIGAGAIFSQVQKNPLALISTGIIGTIAVFVFDIITVYTNHIVSDPRNKDQSIGSAISEVFSLGFKLLGKTIMVYLKYHGIPLIIFLALTGMVIFSGDDAIALIGIIALVGLLFAIYFLLISPVISARIADNYLDYKGDIDASDDIFIEDRNSNNKHTITRNY